MKGDIAYLRQSAMWCSVHINRDPVDPRSRHPSIRFQRWSMPLIKSPSLSASQSPRQNQLLAALLASEYERLLPHLEQVPLELGRALYESGSHQWYVYFPTDSIVSLLYVME